MAFISSPLRLIQVDTRPNGNTDQDLGCVLEKSVWVKGDTIFMNTIANC